MEKYVTWNPEKLLEYTGNPWFSSSGRQWFMRVPPSEAIVTFGYEVGQQKPEDRAKHQT